MQKQKDMKLTSLVTSVTTAGYLMMSNVQIALADNADKGKEITTKLTSAITVIQGVITGLIVVVGVCVALFIILKRLPDADNPREKNEVYQSVGRVAGLVALGAAVVWILPWVYGLFT